MQTKATSVATDKPEAEKKKKKKRSDLLPSALRNFDQLPDSANVRIPVVAALCGCSEMTVWRRSKAGTLPPTRKQSEKVTTMNVGAIRKVLNSTAA